jgi:phage repressor protein C with HTH and peptisase S24 domain
LKESISATLRKITLAKNPTQDSEYLIFAEAVLNTPLNPGNEVMPMQYVLSNARVLRQKILSEMNKGSVTVAPTPHTEHNDNYVTDAVDITPSEEHFPPRAKRLFDTMAAPGGDMLAVVPDASIHATIEEPFQLKISGDAMSGMIEPGSIVLVDPNVEVKRGFVVFVPRDETDVRRYVRLLQAVTEADFWAWRSNPPDTEVKQFSKSQFRCLKITAITGMT